ncbi:hypothetical protein PTSG_03360 [Salpingoeca rosetta]|uniref:AB hydrolase-1 domain-containing protein n=1 Tax=Salpingoeca rosetta (strain ATCC 50818 / BSB-021) TaxID=946362 RepID=F2U4Y3_SALR5|nr:uncharacterized protein PTSG_03360 [Salpingoeca rosetta]EGD82699.1 hypothetical protein PTSG_03360 [Salpingoeca rosetta]|eukprot:XP_004995935.1 hypothetical protein PTSG_03360 [Salpingoeca rosetta]
MTRAGVLVLVVVAVLVALGVAGIGVEGQQVISWSADNCPTEPEGEGEVQDGKECAEVTVPLHGAGVGDTAWLNVNDAGNNNDTITLFVRRYRPEARNAGASRGQLWLIPGGPGQAGSEMTPLTAHFADEPYTLVIADHRGTGRSSYLGCPDAEAESSPAGPKITLAEWGGCIQHLEAQWTRAGLQGFSTTNAARDVRYIASLIREEEEAASGGANDYKITLFGSSYGTLVANRAVLLEEEEDVDNTATSLGRVIDAIALDGTVYPKGYVLTAQSQFFTAALRVTLDACAVDDTCGGYLGLEPSNTLDLLLERLRGGHCRQAGIDPEEYRLMLGMLNSLQPAGLPHILVTASIVRLLRCGEDDLPALRRFNDFTHTVVSNVRASLTHGPGFSQAALMAVAAQEIIEDLPVGSDDFWTNTDRNLERSLHALFVHPRVVAYPIGLIRLPRDAYAGRTPTSLHVPVLLLSGLLDANTPHLFSRLMYLDYMQAQRPAGVAPPKMLVASTSGHGVLNQDTRALPCMLEWMDDPHGFDAEQCMPFVPLSFTSPSEHDRRIFGDTPYGASPPDTGPAGLLPRTGAEDAIAAAVSDGSIASASDAQGGRAARTVTVFVVLDFLVLLALCGFVAVLARRSSPPSSSSSSSSSSRREKYSLQENLLPSSDTP